MAAPEWSAAAKTDFLRIVSWIADKNPSAAEALSGRIAAKVARLPEHPRLYRQGRIGGTREMVVHPNYIVVYEETLGRVRILRVLHARRRWP